MPPDEYAPRPADYAHHPEPEPPVTMMLKSHFFWGNPEHYFFRSELKLVKNSVLIEFLGV